MLEVRLLRLPLLCCLGLCLGVGLPCSALQFGVVTPARLSAAVRLAAGNQTAHSAHSQCTQDLARWTAALSRQERWAAEMADSWTKSVTGLLHGNTYDFGDFDECIYASSEQESQATSPVIRGAYLLPLVSITCTNKSAVVSRSAQLMLELVPLQLRVSLCVPDSCGQDLMLAALRFVAKDLLGEEGLGEAFSADVSLPAGRLQTEANSFRPGWAHWAYLGLVAFLLMLAVVSTILDFKLDDAMETKTARQRWRFVLHFSLRSGMRRLLAPAHPGSMKCINGLRVLSTLWIMAGHTHDFQAPASNARDIEKVNSALPFRMLTSYSYSVDTFLAIAGLVCCFSFMRAAEKTNSFNWIKYIIHRYARTTPAVVFVILYGATWFNIAYPAVDSYVHGEKSISHWYREYGWTSLLHISNFFADLNNFQQHTWYLSVDMQLYVLAPLVLIPLWKRPLLGKVLLALWTLAACLIPAVLSVVYKSKDATGNSHNDRGYFLRKMLYFGTESRMSPYVVGIAAGYFLHQFKKGGQNFQINRVHAAVMWLVSAGTALAVIFAPHSIETVSHSYNAVESFFFVGFTRLAWGVSILLVIIACETGWGGPVNQILSMGFLTPLAKLSFALYLVHFFIVEIDLLYVVHVVEYFSIYSWVRQLLSSMTLALPFAALLHLIVEQPLVLLETELCK